eukprot:scaffold70717_cov42-Cyclotella_meneghiniana.AAC.8
MDNGGPLGRAERSSWAVSMFGGVSAPRTCPQDGSRVLKMVLVPSRWFCRASQAWQWLLSSYAVDPSNCRSSRVGCIGVLRGGRCLSSLRLHGRALTMVLPGPTRSAMAPHELRGVAEPSGVLWRCFEGRGASDLAPSLQTGFRDASDGPRKFGGLFGGVFQWIRGARRFPFGALSLCEVSKSLGLATGPSPPSHVPQESFVYAVWFRPRSWGRGRTVYCARLLCFGTGLGNRWEVTWSLRLNAPPGAVNKRRGPFEPSLLNT